MALANIESVREGGVLTLRFNRADKLNAWSSALVDELTEEFRKAAEDEQVRVIILTAQGKAFSVGGDLNEFISSTPDQVAAFNKKVIALFSLMESVRKPIVASVNGYCNLETIQACDYVLAARSAKFGLPEVNVGISPGAGILVRLPRLIGRLAAKEIAFFGEWIGAERACELGVINRVVDDDKLQEVTRELAAKLAEKPPLTLGAIKAVINKSWGMELDGAMEYQLRENMSLFYTEDLKEGIRSFLEKRKPVFKGR
ncbi:MAG: enoyl-CoA hydratase/isomerase family protein [Thermoprotei archaeon]